jgi:hypothetical protein
MSLPPFADLTKNIKDFFTKGFPGEKSKVESNTSTITGHTFISSVTREEDNTYVGLFNPKYARPDLGLNLNASVDTKGEMKAEVSVADQLVDGLKTTLNGQVGGDPKKNPPVKAVLEYKNENATVTTTLDLLRETGTTFTVGVVLGHEGIVGGFEPQVQIEKQELVGVNAALGYRQPSFEAYLNCAYKPDSLLAKGSYLHKVTSDLKVLAEAEVNVKKYKEEVPNVQIGASYQLDALSSVKARANAQGVVGWAFTHQLSTPLKLVFGGSVNAKKLNESNEHKFGLELVYTS